MIESILNYSAVLSKFWPGLGTPHTRVTLLEEWASITNHTVLNICETVSERSLLKGKLAFYNNMIVDLEG